MTYERDDSPIVLPPVRKRVYVIGALAGFMTTVTLDLIWLWIR